MPVQLHRQPAPENLEQVKKVPARTKQLHIQLFQRIPIIRIDHLKEPEIKYLPEEQRR
jgi:hypothetical protein